MGRLGLIVILLILFTPLVSAQVLEEEIGSETLDQLDEGDTIRISVILDDTPSNNVLLTQADVVSSINVEPKRQLKSAGGFTTEVSKQELEKLLNNGRVKELRIVPEFQLFLQDTVPFLGADEVHLTQIDGIDITGTGQTVCIIDTGVDYTHLDLGGGFGLGKKVLAGYDYGDSDSDPMDESGHGTHVAGIVAANGSVKGIAPNARIYAMKVFGASGGTFDMVADAIDDCVANASTYNITTISMSLGSTLYYSDYCDSENFGPTLSDVKIGIDVAVGNDISVVIAAGNNYTFNPNKVSFPACLANATIVTSTTKSDSIVDYANRGVNFTNILAAPGGNSSDMIISTQISGGSVGKHGTSMAAPHVAGAIALMKQVYSGESPKFYEDVLNITGLNLYDSVTNTYYSSIDILNAINYLLPPAITINEPINNSIIYSAFNLIIETDDPSIDTCWYNLNEGQGNATFDSNLTHFYKSGIDFQNLGNKTIDVYCNDTLQLVGNQYVVTTRTSNGSEIQINEYFPEPSTGFYDWIELYNPVQTTFNLTNWTLDDDTSTMHTFENTDTIAGGEFLIINVSNRLNSAGDSITLKDASGLTVHNTNYSGSTENESIGLILDSKTLGYADFSSPSPKESNNRLPIFNQTNYSIIGSEDTYIDFTPNTTEPDGEAVTFSSTTLPSSATLSTTTGTLTWTPDFTQSGNYSINLTASDGLLNATVPITFDIANINRKPSFLSIPISVALPVYGLYQYDFDSADPDGEVLDNYTVSVSPTTGATYSINQTSGVFDFTSNDNNETYTITVVTTDDDYGYDTYVFVIQMYSAVWTNFTNSSKTTDLSKIDIENVTELVLASDSYGIINFTVPDMINGLNLTGLNLNEFIKIDNNRIEVNSTALAVLDIAAKLTLYGLTVDDPQIERDGSVCPSSVCTLVSYGGGTIVFTVTGFSEYTVAETPSDPPSDPPGGGGGGGGGGFSTTITENETLENSTDIVIPPIPPSAKIVLGEDDEDNKIAPHLASGLLTSAATGWSAIKSRPVVSVGSTLTAVITTLISMGVIKRRRRRKRRVNYK